MRVVAPVRSKLLFVSLVSLIASTNLVVACAHLQSEIASSPAASITTSPQSSPTSSPTSPTSSPTSPTPTPLSPQQWQTLLPGQTKDNLTFTEDGKLLYGSQPLLPEIPVSYSSDGTVTPAKRLLVSPASPSGRYNVIKACETTDETGLCWSVYLIDRAEITAQKVNIGKYGGLDWVEWSAEESRAVFLEKMEGTAWFIGMNLTTGETHLAEELPAQPDLKTFTWTGEKTFQVQLANSSVYQGDVDAILARP